jgi:hypothetical protein
MTLQMAVENTRLFVPFVLSYEITEPSRLWKLEEKDRQLCLMMELLEPIIYF